MDSKPMLLPRIDCAICDKPIAQGDPATEWHRSPWGDGDDWAHIECADNWEPDDEDIYRNTGPTLTERQDAARRLK